MIHQKLVIAPTLTLGERLDAARASTRLSERSANLSVRPFVKMGAGNLRVPGRPAGRRRRAGRYGNGKNRGQAASEVIFYIIFELSGLNLVCNQHFKVSLLVKK